MGDFISKFQTPVFNICVGILEEESMFNLDDLKIVKSILSSKNFIDLNPIVIEADPFLFVKDDTLYLFYEEQRGNKGKGILKMTSTQDLKTWTTDVVILEELFHLSYPNVFEYDGRIYMMPESGHNNDIRLYEMAEDLQSCRFVKSLIEGANFVDSTIFRHDNVNYLFTSVYKGNNQYEARIYIGDDNLDNWHQHPQSPFSTDNGDARCGGSIMNDGRTFYRIAQDCSGNYGGGLNAYSIDELSPVSYKETFSCKLMPSRIYRNGGHQFSIVKFRDKQIVTVDDLSKSIFIRDIVARLCYKLTKK